jgi:cystathionine gamma-synthase
MSKRRAPSTIAASAGVAAPPPPGSVAPPLWSSDTYAWPDAETKPPYDYARSVNPNRDMLAGALAELEGAAGGAVTNSGQSALLLATFLVPHGGLVVAPHDCYGGTYRLLSGLAERGTLRVRFVDQRNAPAFAAAMAERPAMVWIETPSNPLLRLVDIAALAAAGRAAGALVVADNTLPTPVRQRPLELGCDLVMHSTTKALNGHGDLIGGALLARDPAVVETIAWWANAAGLTGGAHDAHQTLRGLRTLDIRVARQESSAREIAEWLAEQPEVAAVHYPGLATHPDHALSLRQQDGPGFVIAFDLHGGLSAARALTGALELVTLASSLGSYATLICTPASMTHRGMPPEAQAAAGIGPGLLRLSVGLEDAGDLIADLARGLVNVET